MNRGIEIILASTDNISMMGTSRHIESLEGGCSEIKNMKTYFVKFLSLELNSRRPWRNSNTSATQLTEPQTKITSKIDTGSALTYLIDHKHHTCNCSNVSIKPQLQILEKDFERITLNLFLKSQRVMEFPRVTAHVTHFV